MKSAIWLTVGHATLLTGAIAEAYCGWHPTGTMYALVGLTAGICYGLAFAPRSAPQRGIEP